MSQAQVQEALDRFEGLLRAQRAPVVGSLRPGVADDRLAELEHSRGGRIPAEASTIWRWHDGLAADRGPLSYLIPIGQFRPLEDSLRFGADWVRLRGSALADLERDGVEVSDRDAEQEYFRGGRLVALIAQNVGYMIDITPGARLRTFMNDPAARTDDYAIVPIADRIDSWSEMLETRAWIARPDGTWAIDHTKVPPTRALMF